ncbi:hypothetical protein OIE62_31900 [Streptomyces scopuliridis]|uniref:Uncharacterized protein n=1 Tax=Streptomyces scopuliridis TaxID=452529 RepID=A0ACD4ZG32_9ACTN|nr:hypothetical protein [Streptomyces scopuliridis]WSB32893.1 hypothetical protein OG949_08450 [Streptomyces scopuliridis]WSB97140.1 hypothetical protein OG835_09035 [Streptomyces scopuliridis]WSC09156.1 hypothetical protein OIE62_31900 [Streptomyces scopuliridis]
MKGAERFRRWHAHDHIPGPPPQRDRGQSGAEYAAMVGVVSLVVAAIVGLSVPTDEATGLKSAVCRILHPLSGAEACSSGDYAGDGDDGGGDGGGGDPDDPFVPNGDPFEPAKCLLSQDQTKTTVVIQILFIKISSSESVKLQQWSDGTVTLERVTETGGGVTASISAGIPGLKDWGGSASLSGSYVKGSGSGGQWLFNGNKSGDPQADLAANLEDAQQFAEYLKAQSECNSRPAGPRSSELGMICGYHAGKKKPDLEPEKAPDVDITKTSTEASGGVSFGKTFKGNGKSGKDTKGGKDGKGADGPKDLGSISFEGLSGSMTEDVVVMRAKTGPDAGKITFVYTFSVSGTAGGVAQAKGSRMQQVAVTYDAAAYDQEEKDGKPHHPQKLTITTSQESGDGPGIQAGAGANAGPVTIDVGGGGGTVNSQIHTESAEVTLDNDTDSTAVEDWLRGRGDAPASNPLPTPSDAAEALDDDAGPIERLLHDKGKLTRLDYNANTDWWNASLGIGFGISAGQVSLGFKLFGIDITHEEKNQTITGDPTYATGPKSGGARPWVEWKNCTRTKPIPT